MGNSVSIRVPVRIPLVSTARALRSCEAGARTGGRQLEGGKRKQTETAVHIHLAGGIAWRAGLFFRAFVVSFEFR